jgi:acid phosphatase
MRQRYGHLATRRRPTKFWSCGSLRDIETAECFASGFFGSDWRTDGSAVLEVIPETEDLGANTLTPGDTCYNYATDNEEGHDKGYIKLAKWQATFGKPIAERLADDASGVTFSPLDIYGMMEMCGFEILARGGSPWCDVFTREEWLQFEYARDLLHYYRAGPGNMFGPLMGWLWLNATQTLMSDHSSNDVYFSFVHDGDIIPALATLGVFSEPLGQEELPTDRVATERKWKTSDVVPMGGRLIFERISCETTEITQGKVHGVRLFVNDALVDLTILPHALGFPAIEGAISLESFQTFLSVRGAELGDFREICGLDNDAPDRIRFLHQQLED